MPVSRLFYAALMLGLLAVPAGAADHNVCLTKSEQRAAVAANRAIPLAKAIKSLYAHGRRAEVVRARLCRNGDSLVYLLTLLGRSGKVTSVTVDASGGKLITGRAH
jgi:uncharacterized membrane protein YkoI